MRKLNLALIIILLSFPSLALAETSITKIRNFGANCSLAKASQLCDATQLVSVRVRGASARLRVKFAPSPQSCSSIRFHIFRDGVEVGVTDPTNYGSANVAPLKINLGKFKPGKYLLGFQAEGILGGCNSGLLGSWAGEFKFTAVPSEQGGVSPTPDFIFPLGVPNIGFSF